MFCSCSESTQASAFTKPPKATSIWEPATNRADELAGFARPTASRHLQTLRKHGLAAWDGQGPKDPRASWALL